jgi:mono/diheme cytochrome c family protein
MIIAMVSCNKVRRSPGRAYMPDMYYSRAYETYASTENLQQHGIHYTALPVKGTIARGDMLDIYPYANDSAGYVQSATFKSPLNPDSINMKEAERLYLVNCGICHGPKLDGNGPLYKDGNGPYSSKPATLVGDPKYAAMAEGTMFHSVTYGKNAMGSYASQLNTQQRWMVIAYIKSKQSGGKAVTDSTGKAPADTTKKMM